MSQAIQIDQNPLITIVIPTKNESKDIENTLDACVAIKYQPKEILVVDDSNDDTPQIVANYSEKGVRLIHREINRNACCGARNLGMQQAKGDIVVLLNADAIPRTDFLTKIVAHYNAGADYLVVRSVLKNTDNLWGLYKFAETQYRFNPDPNWTEGFSCRKKAAETVGYIPGDFPVPFCRDYMFGQALRKAGFKKHVDMEIPMEHIWPDNIKEFWGNQVHRGAHSAPTYFFFHNHNLTVTTIREILKITKGTLRILLIIPPLINAIHLSKFTPRGWRSIPELFFADIVDHIAVMFGNFKGVFRLWQAKDIL